MSQLGVLQCALVKVLAAVSNGLVDELTSQGVEVAAVTSPEGASDLPSKAGDASFVVIDQSLPFAAELMVKLKAGVDGPDRDRLPIVAVGTPNGLRCVPDTHLATATASQIVEVGKSILMRRARQRRLFDQEAVLEVPTTPEYVEKAGELLDQLIGAAGYSDEDGVKLGQTIREAIGNAAEHGNKNDPELLIHINFLRSTDRLTVVITDEGNGFDTENFLNRAEQVSALEHTRSRRGNEQRPGGLGVFIMKKTCDEIMFNTSGNAIYLMKFLPK